MNQKLLKLLELLEIYQSTGALREEFEALANYDTKIKTIDDLIEAMGDEMSYWDD